MNSSGLFFLYQPTTTKHSTVHDVLAFFEGFTPEHFHTTTFVVVVTVQFLLRARHTVRFIAFLVCTLGGKRKKSGEGGGHPKLSTQLAVKIYNYSICWGQVCFAESCLNK